MKKYYGKIKIITTAPCYKVKIQTNALRTHFYFLEKGEQFLILISTFARFELQL